MPQKFIILVIMIRGGSWNAFSRGSLASNKKAITNIAVLFELYNFLLDENLELRTQNSELRTVN